MIGLTGQVQQLEEVRFILVYGIHGSAQNQILSSNTQEKQDNMSELSFLIENQNSVIVDESYLQKCKKDEEEGKKKEESSSNGPTRVLSSKEIKINRNFFVNRKKHTSPNSINYSNTSAFKSESSDANEQLYKIGLRIDVLGENQKRLEQRFGKEFMGLQERIFQSKNNYNMLFDDLKKIRAEMNESKKNIGQLLTNITAKGR